MQIHYQLATLKKGNSSIADYFHQFTSLIDTLVAIDHLSVVLSWFPSFWKALALSFESFVSFVTTCVDPFSLEDLYGHSLAHKIRLEQQPTIDLSLASANFANRGNTARGGRDGRHSTTSHSPRAEFPLLAKLALVRERSSVGYF